MRPLLLPLALVAVLLPGTAASGNAGDSASSEITASWHQPHVRPVPNLPAQPAGYWLSLAKAGVASAERAWRARSGWYYEHLGGKGSPPLATVWGAVPLFQAINAIAIAEPSRANKTAVARFARHAEGFYSHRHHAYAPYPRTENPDRIWFDDNGWWGLAFVNAYRATGNRRYLADAMRSLRFIATRGWARNGGGIWWDTSHPYKAGEALTTASLLATLLWANTHSRFALAQARKFIGWANSRFFSSHYRLYRKSSLQETPIDYIQAPLAHAQLILCKLGQLPSGCARAREVIDNALQRFGYVLTFSPQYDAPYIQWSLASYALDGDSRLYQMAVASAQQAAALARDSRGLYLRGWAGQTLPPELADPGMLRTDAATVSVFAWLAATKPPVG